MASRAFVAGRVVLQSRDMRVRVVDPRKGVPRTKRGDIADSAAAIGVNDAGSPFALGIPFTDEDDGITYRVVTRLDPMDGWASEEFWQRRWGVPHASICVFVETGHLDAAMEENTMARRYRCRDERALKESDVYRAERRRGAVARSNAKRVRSSLMSR